MWKKLPILYYFFAVIFINLFSQKSFCKNNILNNILNIIVQIKFSIFSENLRKFYTKYRSISKFIIYISDYQ